MKKATVSIVEISIITFILTKSLYLLFLFPKLISTPSSIFISIILGTLLGLGIITMYLSIKNKYKSSTLFQIIKNNYSKTISIILSIILFISLLLLASYLTFSISTYINNSLVPKISILIISITFLLLVYLISKKGIETLCRTSLILFYIFILLFIISILGLTNEINIELIKPLLDINNSIIKECIYYALFTTGPLLFLLEIPKNNIIDNKHESRSVIISYLVSSLIIMIFVFLTISILGNDLANIYQYASTMILRKVTFLNIIERLETVLSLHFLFDLLILLSSLFIFIKDGLNTIIKTKEKKKDYLLILTTIFILIASNYIPHLKINYIYIYLIVTIFIPLIIFIKPKKNSK